MKRKKEGCFISFLVVILLAGLFLAMFPILWGAAMDKTISENAQLFLKRDESAEPTNSYVSESQPEESMAYAQLWEEMVAYNKTIYAKVRQGCPANMPIRSPALIWQITASQMKYSGC